MLEKNSADISDLERTLLCKTWPHQSKVEPVYDKHGLADYAISPKHLIYGKDAEFYSYGEVALKRNRIKWLSE